MEGKNMSINMNDKSKVKNLCPWNVSWENINSTSDEFIKANKFTYISNAEIEVQVQNGNVFFGGTDGLGSHARVYIENPEMREYLGFDNKVENKKQLILDDDKCKEIMEYKTFNTFKKHIAESVVTKQEKNKIMDYARKIKINDFDKIEFLQNHCGLTFKYE
jgi:hypothetical protein